MGRLSGRGEQAGERSALPVLLHGLVRIAFQRRPATAWAPAVKASSNTE